MHRHELTEFNPKGYYHEILDDTLIDEDNQAIKLKKEAMDLVIRYYAEKYRTEIFVLAQEALQLKYSDNFFLKILEETNNNEKSILQQVYIVRSPMHSEIYVYLKNGSKRAIFHADSRNDESDLPDEQIQDVHNEYGNNIRIFFLPSARQGDSYSCHTDALVWGRIVSAKNADATYRLNDFLSFLENHSHRDTTNECFIVDKLPDELLVTSQKSSFFKSYLDSQNKPIHKKMNLNEFNNKYTKEMQVDYYSAKEGKVNGKKQVANYLRMKGLRYAGIVEMQFYAEQLAKQLGDKWPEVKTKFYDQAKNILRATPKSTLYKFANEFQKNVLAKTTSVRP